MTAYNKFQPFVENVAEKVYSLGTDQLKVALTNSAPVASNGTLSQITEIAYTNLSTRNITTTTSAQTTGTYKLVLADLTLTSTGGTTGPFRYIVIYDDTATNDELIAWYDNASSVTLNDGDQFVVDFDGSAGFLTLA